MSIRPIAVVPGLAPALAGAPVHAQLVDSAGAGTVLDGARMLVEGSESSEPALDALAAQIAAQLDAAGLTEVALVAESWAATAALRFAARNPQQLSELVLVAPLGFASPLSGSARGLPALAKVVHDLHSGQPDDVRSALSDLGLAGPPQTLVEEYAAADDRARAAGALLGRLIGSGEFDLTRRAEGDGLRDVRTPVTLVWGRDDKWATLDSAFYLERRLRDAQLRVVPNVGHLVTQQWGPGLFRYAATVLGYAAGDDASDRVVGARAGELAGRKGA